MDDVKKEDAAKDAAAKDTTTIEKLSVTSQNLHI